MARRFDWQFRRFACWRALFSAGSNTDISSAIIPMTTNNSTSVNPAAKRERLMIAPLVPDEVSACSFPPEDYNREKNRLLLITANNPFNFATYPRSRWRAEF